MKTTKSGRFEASPEARKLEEAKLKADEATSYVERKMAHRLRRMKAVLAGEPVSDEDATGRYPVVTDAATQH